MLLLLLISEKEKRRKDWKEKSQKWEQRRRSEKRRGKEEIRPRDEKKMRTDENKRKRRKGEQQEKKKRKLELKGERRRNGCRQLLQIKAGQISYRTPLLLLNLLFLPSSSSSSVRWQNAYHQGNPLITTATHSITVRCTKNQSFHWWQASCRIRTTYLNRSSVNQLM